MPNIAHSIPSDAARDRDVSRQAGRRTLSTFAWYALQLHAARRCARRCAERLCGVYCASRRCRFRTNCGRTSDCVPVAVPPSDIHNPPLLWVRSPNPLTQAIRLTASSAPHRLSIQEFPVDGACWPLRFTQHLWHQMACIALAPESVYTTPTSRFAGGVVLSIKARGACAAT